MEEFASRPSIISIVIIFSLYILKQKQQKNFRILLNICGFLEFSNLLDKFLKIL